MVETHLEEHALTLREAREHVSLEVATQRDEGSDEALLLVHGFGDNLHTWKGLRAALRARGATVVCIDLPGFGASPLVPGFASGYVRNAAELVLAIARAGPREKKWVAIGNSLGASVLLCAASVDRQAPAPRALESLVLLAPATKRTRTPPFMRLLQLPTYRWMERLNASSHLRSKRAAMEVVARVAIRAALAPGRRPDPAWRRSVVEALSRPGAWSDLEEITRDLLRSLRGRVPELLTLDRAAPPDLPVVVARGSLDPVIGAAELDELAARLPRGKRLEMPGIGHCPQIEDPRAVARLACESLDAL